MPASDTGPRVIDTSVWIRADRKGHDALRDLLVAGSVWICWPIRAELLIGVKTPERWAILNEQLAALEQAPVLDQTWERAARLGNQLARKGQSVPLPDLLTSAWPPAVERSICSAPISQRFPSCTKRNGLMSGPPVSSVATMRLSARWP